jgi:hypothetical protein
MVFPFFHWGRFVDATGADTGLFDCPGFAHFIAQFANGFEELSVLSDTIHWVGAAFSRRIAAVEVAHHSGRFRQQSQGAVELFFGGHSFFVFLIVFKADSPVLSRAVWQVDL